MRFDRTDLPCGCRRCGCLCPEHAIANMSPMCATHVGPAVSRDLAREAWILLSAGLALALVLTWMVVLRSPSWEFLPLK